MGRIVIETDPETGKDHVQLTLDNGQTLIFHGDGNSELRLHKAETDYIDVTGTDGVKERIPGLVHPERWSFSLNIDNIPGIIHNDPEPSEE
ncbi:MAG TPA: hypothetical protein VHC20_05975 [Candidatus Paceibacterota bacterium]|nr:hypothetical protein [Candidatus Paceibacterota bacterium]